MSDEKKSKNDKTKNDIQTFIIDPFYSKQVNKLLKVDLINLCKEMNISEEGLKKDLIERLNRKHETEMKAFQIPIGDDILPSIIPSVAQTSDAVPVVEQKYEEIGTCLLSKWNYCRNNSYGRQRFDKMFKARPSENKEMVIVSLDINTVYDQTINRQFLDWYEKELIRVLVTTNNQNNRALGRSEICSVYNSIPHDPILFNGVKKRYKENHKLFVRPYEYQKDNVSWMLSIEDFVIKGDKANVICDYSDRYIPIGIDSNLIYNTNNNGVLIMNHNKISFNNPTYTRGGILGDEMGIGKTLCVTDLIIQNPYPKYSIARYSNQRYNTKATMVICPPQLVEQWKNEMLNYTCDGILVYTISTSVEWSKLTYKHILMADVVVISTNFFKKHCAYYDRFEFTNLQKSKNPIDKNYPNLNFFNWWRLVVDEGHEFICANEFIQCFKYINSVFRWYISGTPLPNNRLPSSIAQFLDMKSSSHSPNYNDMFYSMFKHIYSRKTRDTIKKECAIIPYKEEVIRLEMTKVEHGLYLEQERKSRHNDERLRMICTHLLLADRNFKDYGGNTRKMKTLDEIKIITLRKRKQELKKVIDSIAYDEKMLTQLVDEGKSRFSNGSDKTSEGKDTDEKKEYNEKCGNFKRAITNGKKKKTDLEHTITYFENMVNSLQKNADCVICLDTMNNKALTKCGHIFCYECISQAVDIQKKCPNCRTQLTPSDIIVYNDNSSKDGNNEEKKECSSKEDIKTSLINKYGTKVAELIWRIKNIKKNDPKAKIIVFSQWDRMLNLVSRSLHAEEITNAFCKGSVFQRRNVVNRYARFNDPRVLMLSLKNSASGLNLTNAAYIFLMDTVTGTPEEVNSIEQQAISRSCRIGQNKQVSVIRLIISNTIEDNVYQNHMNDLKKRSIGDESGITITEMINGFDSIL